jgi:thiol-disulfide isomerase/thioredoxin
MTSGRRAAVLTLAVLVTAGSILPMIGRGDPAANAPAPSTQAAGRTPKQILADLQATSAELHDAMPLSGFFDETVRKANGAKAIPLLRKMTVLLGELRDTQTEPDAKADLTSQQHEFYSFLVAFGDDQTVSFLKSESASPDHATAVQAQSTLALGRWWKNSKDAAEQVKVLDDYTTVVKANPTDPGIVQTLGTMMQLGPANDDVLGRLINVVKTNMKGAAAESLVTAAQGTRDMHAMIGKPFTVAGRTVTGGKFNSDDWKGKVILVDFWATWCVPCVAELPHVKKLYDEQHAKGLEVVGIDCDPADQQVIAFTRQHQIPWPQVRETSQNDDDQWSPLAKQWHVMQIPTMFLIDRKGNLRYTDALEGTDEKVAALLAEQGPATQPAAK